MSKSKPPEMARALALGIAQGQWPVGSLLPTEFELCEHFGASRYAVRAALQELQELGLISRRKNVGTRVESAQPVAGFTQSIATVDELAQFGAAHVRQVHRVGEIVVDLLLAQEMDCAGGSRWLRISSLRMDGDKKRRPICWTHLYIDPRSGIRIARIRQHVRAVSLSAELAELLKAETGAPALQLVRHYLDASGQAFEISVTTLPADRFTFSMELERSRE